MSDDTRGAARPWSCDTFLVAADRSADAATIHAKNSDRPAGETRPLRFHPARSGGGTLDLAHLDLPDAPRTYAHVGASPYWCWGHELGLNERGVAIGNEALFTRSLAGAVSDSRAGRPPEPGVLGMELLRLGLERAATADEALDVMTALLERYGQWGTGVGGERPETGAYDNAYVIADASGGWVLETTGRHWAARRIDSGTCSISNQPTIRDDADRTSPDLRGVAVQEGWWPPDADGLDFARAVTDPKTPLQASILRLQRSRQLLRRRTRGRAAGDGRPARPLRGDVRRRAVLHRGPPGPAHPVHARAPGRLHLGEHGQFDGVHPA